ncbi:non-ribosomal peptide synthetase [Cellulosilyticum ruminicola]|uniref:non-ribosomal peptide synthetase n=1 Tax=Cellulosilyticum ruminicola TaxID=425254 RepID=UPI0006CFDB0C|nr:amino acid adenylation domain-containing protein [Cellulosilyticum ruminicola]
MAAFIKPFDLEKPSLMHVKIVKLAAQEYILLWDKHHIISDGVSEGILMNELVKLYNDKVLEPVRLQYKDFAVWQNQLPAANKLIQKEYWLNKFAGELNSYNLPTDYMRPSIIDFNGDCISFTIPKRDFIKIEEFIKHNDVTLYMLLMAVYDIVLSKYTRQNDIIVGTPVAGRLQEAIQDTVGLFVNTIALRQRVNCDKQFVEFLQEVKTNILQDISYQEYPFEELIEGLHITRDLSRNPLFDVMFVMQNTDKGTAEIEGLEISSLEAKNKVSKFDMTLLAEVVENELVLNIEYRISLFKAQTIKQFMKHYLNILMQVITNPMMHMSKLKLMDTTQENEVACVFNQTKIAYESEKTICELFEQQVVNGPKRIALKYHEMSMTYEMLNEKANGLAAILRDKAVGENTIVGMLMNRSPEMIIGILGILKAGAAYLPIDPSYPQARKDYILKDSKVKILITNQDDLGIEYFSGEVIHVSQEIQGQKENICLTRNIDNLAYVIYTSGSTGQPKGVMLSHRGVVNLKTYFEMTLGINDKDCILQFASSSFDASVWEIFMALEVGATLCLIDTMTISDSSLFETYLTMQQVTVATLPPAYLTYLNPEHLKSLRMVITAGSATNLELVKRWMPYVKYINAYGPTETTICATSWQAKLREDNRVPIGKPIANTEIYIMDEWHNLLPVGIVGEIVIGGVGVAKGYLNRPQLTKEKFVKHPIQAEQMVYRTGDLGRWLPDGQIEF